MICVGCHPTAMGRDKKVRIKHRRCTEDPKKLEIIKEYELAN